MFVLPEPWGRIPESILCEQKTLASKRKGIFFVQEIQGYSICAEFCLQLF